MIISESLLNEDFPLKYYYCTLENKEFILIGDNNGLIYDTYSCTDIGNVLIDIFKYKDVFIDLINNYIEKISNEVEYKDDKLLSQDIILTDLYNLQKEINNYNSYFKIADIPTDISQKYRDLFMDFQFENQKKLYNINNLNKFKKLVSTKYTENKEALEFLTEHYKKQEAKLNNLKDSTFKQVVVEHLKLYIDEINLCLLNVFLYSANQNNYDISINDEKIEKQNIIAYNYNFINIFRKFESYIKGIYYHDNKLFTDDALKNFPNHKIQYIQVFKFNNVVELLNLSIINTFNKKIPINICMNCKKLFIPDSRSDEKYCSNPSPQNPNKTCKEYGAKKTYRDEIKSHPIKYEHNKTSQFYRMRINRSKNTQEKEKYERKFNAYKENYERKKKQYNSNKLKENDFVEWITKQKEGVKNGSSRTNKK